MQQGGSPSFAGWVWVLPGSKASLLPRSPEKQKAAKRWAVLKGHKLHLSIDAESEPQVVVELASCEVLVAEGAFRQIGETGVRLCARSICHYLTTC